MRKVVALAIALALASACHGNDTPAPTACTLSSDCAGGQTCLGGVCTGAACTAALGLDTGPARDCSLGDLPPLVSGNGGKPIGPATAPVGCQKPVVCSALPASQVQIFGAHAAGDVVHFNVPAGTIGLSIVSQALKANDTVTVKDAKGKTTVIDNTVVPDKVKGPDGTVLYDDFAIPTDTDGGVLPTVPIVYGAGSPSTGAMTVPNTTAALQGGLPAGTWQFTVNDYARECAIDSSQGCTAGAANGNTYDIQVVTKPGPLPSKGVLDVSFYIVSNHGGALTANSAPNLASVKRMVQALSRIYSRAGICLGTVTFYDLPSWAQAKYSTINADKTSPCDDLSQLFTLSLPGNGLNIFLVEALTAKTQTGEGTVVGLDGTIPGPSSAGGTIHSGAVVSVADLTSGSCLGGFTTTCGADEVAYITAHEGGHFLGLFHTSEQAGDSWDSLSDTPICDCTKCTSATTHCAQNDPANTSPTLVTPSVCRQGASTQCQGADNLMFWEFDNASIGNLSSQQGQVMRANPLLR